MINPKTLKVNVLRAELRNRKIIIVLEPDLLTNEVFAVNPFYDEGAEKNKIQDIRIGVWLTERNGKIKIETAEYNGTHYTTGHTQIHYLNSMYLDKKHCAVNEILKTEYKYIEDDGRMNQLLNMWTDEPLFQSELKTLIKKRKKDAKNKELQKAMNDYENARKKLDKLMKNQTNNSKIQ